jgi:hypothetical protein
MATQIEYWAGIAFGDSLNKLIDVSWRVNATMFNAYNGAADDAARLATPLGTFMAGIEGLSECNVFERYSRKQYVQDTASFPSDAAAVYGFDKISVGYKSLGDNYTMTIPGRDDAAYTAIDGKIIIAVGDRTTEVDDFITAMANGMIAKNGGQPVVQKMYVSK